MSGMMRTHEKQILVQWVGPQDLAKATLEMGGAGDGRPSRPEETARDRMPACHALSPLRRLMQEKAFDHVVLLSPFPAEAHDGLGVAHPSMEIVSVQLADAEDFPFILRVSDALLRSTHDRHGPDARIVVNLSSGTGVMIAVWLYLSQTKYPVTLYRVSAEGKCLRVELQDHGATTSPHYDGHREGAHPLGDGFNLEQHLDHLRCCYLRRAMEQARGVKSHAAKLLGMKHYQTLSAQLERFSITGNWQPSAGDGHSSKS